MARIVGATEAKHQLPRLLDEARRGASFLITRRGVPVARLVPVQGASHPGANEVIDEIAAFAEQERINIDLATIRESIEEGRL